MNARTSNPGALPRLRALAYWIPTLIIVTESLVGGTWDILRTDYVRDVLETQLGLPTYVAVVLGVWKIPGAVVLLLPRLPRLKEWAYAGIFFVYTGAFASHLFIGDTAGAFGPLGFAAITMISWALRPASRRDPAPYSPRFARFVPPAPPRGKVTTIAYWALALTVAVVLFSGGIADVAHVDDTLAGMVALGYPAYFLYIIGTWKLLGAVAILAPRFTRLKEWAFAGAFFNFSGAVISHLASGSSGDHVAVTSLFALCTLGAWALRPGSQVLGDLYTGGDASTEPADRRALATVAS
ncbi:DoxX family protein [Phytomonospora sp. NPDC050363]|uniref:DoxX family protein n=1 Tax=Phytomonospora sp. NPDC050363 TaxID=3155642 RepID=UPI0033E1BFF1